MTPQPGTLESIGQHKLGHVVYEYSRCLDCGTEYPHLDGLPSCNGHTIGRCPWCREDSAPYQNGRGI